MIIAPQQDRSAADDLLDPAALAVHVQAGEAGAPVHPPRRRGLRQTSAAAFAGLALAHSIGRAILKGLVTQQGAVLPHAQDSATSIALLSAFGAAREEAFMMLALLTCALGSAWCRKEMASPDLTVWLVALVIQSIPYAAAVAVSIASAFNLPASLLHRADPPATEPGATSVRMCRSAARPGMLTARLCGQSPAGRQRGKLSRRIAALERDHARGRPAQALHGPSSSGSAAKARARPYRTAAHGSGSRRARCTARHCSARACAPHAPRSGSSCRSNRSA